MNHTLVKETKHSVNGDPNVTLSKAYREIADAQGRYGNRAVIILTVSIHVPNMLPMKAGDTNENDDATE
jgi:hypothetical protein